MTIIYLYVGWNLCYAFNVEKKEFVSLEPVSVEYCINHPEPVGEE